MGKVIFLAIDNTLRDFDGTIPASGIEAIRIAQRNGHEVLLNTGRTHFRIGERIMNIGFDGVIANSGGYVEYKGEHIGHRSFTQLAFIELMRDLLECQCTVEMENSKASYILRESVDVYREIGRRVRQSMNLREDEMTGPIAVSAGCSGGTEAHRVQQSCVQGSDSFQMGLFFSYHESCGPVY